MLENEGHQIDMIIYNSMLKIAETSESDEEEEDEFDKRLKQEVKENMALKIKKEKLQEEIEEMEDQLSYFKGHDRQSIDKDIKTIIKAKEVVSNIEKQLEGNLPFGIGPIVTALDDFLKENKITRQQYHGKAFNGNHVHKALQPPVIEKLFQIPAQVLKKEVEKVGIAKMKLIKAKLQELEELKTLFIGYGQVHNQMNRCNVMSEADIQRLESDICLFIEAYKTKSDLIPKIAYASISCWRANEKMEFWSWPLGRARWRGDTCRIQ
ncbi:uncharacterized protein [Antedon mediterranea]|uniref:uncharacterized protein n=1 Tax=Antedon mediterranea TaxID=105859 RepID=UPI003AF7890C